MIARRAATALASFLVLAATGFGWSTLHTLTQAITTSNALSSAAHGSSAGTATDGSVNVLPPPITVDVLNGDGRPGLATTVSNALVSDGLTAGTIGNSTRHSTTVSYGTGAQTQAGALTGLLHAPTATPDTTLAPETISIVLGTGFIPPPDLAQHPAALHAAATTSPTTTPAGQQSPTAAAPGPQGLPVNGTGIPCVD